MKTPGKRIVKIKTIDEFLSTGWEMDSDGNLHYTENDSVSFLNQMHNLAGKVILIEKGFLEEYLTKNNRNGFIITEDMISEEYDIKDYPEYFI
jgi:hypothetical protein